LCKRVRPLRVIPLMRSDRGPSYEIDRRKTTMQHSPRRGSLRDELKARRLRQRQAVAAELTDRGLDPALAANLAAEPATAALLLGEQATAAGDLDQLEQGSVDARNPDHPAHQRQWSIEARLARAVCPRGDRPQGAGGSMPSRTCGCADPATRASPRSGPPARPPFDTRAAIGR
jgi:hypothetical protein